MKKVSIKTTLIALAMFTSMLASCGETTSSNSDKETVTTPVTVKSSTAEVFSPTETNEDSSSVADSSEYETTTTKTSLDDSSDSEKTETTTKAVTDSSDKETTSAKQTTAQPKATTTTKAVVTTTTARATQSTVKPVVTTKATTKAIMKETTRVTTKATRQTNSSFTIPSNATTLQKALYNLCMGNNVSGNAKTAQQEFIKYGKQKMPNYKTSAYLHAFVDRNGNYTDVHCAGNGTSSYEYADGVEWYTFHQIFAGETNPQKAWNSALFFEQEIKKQIDNHAYNLKTDPYPEEVLWYVTFGIQGKSVDVVVLNGSTLDWKY